MTAPQDPTDPLDIEAVIFAIQTNPPVIVKTREGQVGSQKTRYADLVEAHKVVMPRLTAMKTMWKCKPTRLIGTEGAPFVLHYTLKHIPSGTFEEGYFPLRLSENSQQMGSAITYARRYALFAVLNLVAEDEDDDGQGGTGTAKRKPPARPREAATVSRPATAPALPNEAQPTAAPGEWTQPMMRKWMAQNREAGITGDAVKAVAADMLGRQVESSKEITFDEMRGMIDAFEKALKDPDTAAATVIDIYQRTTGSASTAATTTRRPAKRAAPAGTRTTQEQTRDAVLGTPGDESAPWEGELPV